jgi:hypothetical protein
LERTRYLWKQYLEIEAYHLPTTSVVHDSFKGSVSKYLGLPWTGWLPWTTYIAFDSLIPILKIFLSSA